MLFYDENAESYAASTFNSDFAVAVFEGMKSIVDTLDKEKAILDIGCGSGRDANHLTSLGYTVHAFDQSKEMIQQAESLTGLNGVFNVGSAQAFETSHIYDFAYSIACLLHLNDEEFLNAVTHIASHLNDNGHFYFTVKKGTGEETDAAGRYFNYYNSDKLNRVVEQVDNLNLVEIVENPDLTRSDTTWLNVVLQKTA
jgi:2-polyprenyl-3-methyl-5-hydroxy-6-metoxy-1,4-benzoquinol methylase